MQSPHSLVKVLQPQILIFFLTELVKWKQFEISDAEFPEYRGIIFRILQSIIEAGNHGDSDATGHRTLRQGGDVSQNELIGHPRPLEMSACIVVLQVDENKIHQIQQLHEHLVRHTSRSLHGDVDLPFPQNAAEFADKVELEEDFPSAQSYAATGFVAKDLILQHLLKQPVDGAGVMVFRGKAIRITAPAASQIAAGEKYGGSDSGSVVKRKLLNVEDRGIHGESFFDYHTPVLLA